jgi:hypothetical protein
MYKNATKCNETIGKWCKNKHGASKIIDTFETYQIFTWNGGKMPYIGRHMVITSRKIIFLKGI